MAGSVSSSALSLAASRLRPTATVERSAASFFVADLQPDLAVGRVTAFLLLGSQDAAADARLLRSEGVTHVLDVAACGPSAAAAAAALGLRRCEVPLLDLPEAAPALRAALPPCFAFIDAARRAGGRVLLHWCDCAGRGAGRGMGEGQSKEEGDAA